MSAKDSTVILCARVSAGPAYLESEQRACTFCDEAVWVAPSSVDALRETPDARIACTECLKRGRFTVGRVESAPGSGDEIAAILRSRTTTEKT